MFRKRILLWKTPARHRPVSLKGVRHTTGLTMDDFSLPPSLNMQAPKNGEARITEDRGDIQVAKLVKDGQQSKIVLPPTEKPGQLVIKTQLIY